MLVLRVLLAILGISILMIIHEGGHYLVARAFKMRVQRFSIGFGPTLIRYQPKGSPTVFQVGAIPFLAYVQIAGMNPHEEFDANDPGLFPNKSLLARILTIAGGPIANYLAASCIVFGLAVTSWPTDTQPIVQSTTEGSPAAAAGLESGDIIVRAHGQDITRFTQLQEITSARAGQATEYVIERSGERLEPMVITPMLHDEAGIGVIGVTPNRDAVIYATLPAGEAARMALRWPFDFTLQQIKGIASMIERRTTADLGGPVEMGSVMVEAAEAGWVRFLFVMAFISTALGFFNLLPFPALDGGRLCFLAYEAITRRRANERIEATIHTVGILFLLGLMVLVTYRDIARRFTPADATETESSAQSR